MLTGETSQGPRSCGGGVRAGVGGVIPGGVVRGEQIEKPEVTSRLPLIRGDYDQKAPQLTG